MGGEMKANHSLKIPIGHFPWRDHLSEFLKGPKVEAIINEGCPPPSEVEDMTFKYIVDDHLSPNGYWYNSDAYSPHLDGFFRETFQVANSNHPVIDGSGKIEGRLQPDLGRVIRIKKNSNPPRTVIKSLD